MAASSWMFPMLLTTKFPETTDAFLVTFGIILMVSQVFQVYLVTEFLLRERETDRRANALIPSTPSAPQSLRTLESRSTEKLRQRMARHPYLISAALAYSVMAPAVVIGAREMLKEKPYQASLEEQSDEYFRVPYVIAYQPGVIKPYERRALCRLSDPIWWRFEYRQAPVAGYRLEMVPSLHAPIALLPLCTLLPGAVWVIPSRFGSF